jgi:HSP20 family protein
MSNVTVRRTGNEQPRTHHEGESYRLIHWDPFRQMAPYLTGEGHPARFTPDFEIKETKEGFVFRADVPGIKEEDLEITMTGNRLTVGGKRDAPKEENANIYYARECSYGAFSRAFTLPEGTEANDGVHADLSQGVLTLFLEKRPELKPKRIEVKVSDKRKV